MRIKETIEKIVDSGNKEKMYKLNDMLDELICDLKIKDPTMYHEYKKCLYEIAYGKILSSDMAFEIVEHMKPYHEKWTIEETNNLKREHNLSNIRDEDFYVVLNSMYNDYCKVFGDDDIKVYVDMTVAFIDDEDAKKDKVYDYFTTIPKKD